LIINSRIHPCRNLRVLHENEAAPGIRRNGIGYLGESETMKAQ
jgi:hypothetical protein